MEADPSYALGYCGLNSYYGFGAAFGMLPAEEAWPKAEWAIRKALDLDDTLAEAHLGLAALNMVYYLDWAATEKEARRAIELNPQFDEIHFMYSFFLMVMQRFDEAIIEGKRAAACDPFSVRISQHLGSVYYHARRYDEAIRQYQRTLELNPHNASYTNRWAMRASRVAVIERQSGSGRRPPPWMGMVSSARFSARPILMLNLSSVVRAVAAKKVARLAAMKKKGDCVPAINLARAYLRMDDKARALQWLKSACEERNAMRSCSAAIPCTIPCALTGTLSTCLGACGFVYECARDQCKNSLQVRLGYTLHDSGIKKPERNRRSFASLS